MLLPSTIKITYLFFYNNQQMKPNQQSQIKLNAVWFVCWLVDLLNMGGAGNKEMNKQLVDCEWSYAATAPPPTINQQTPFLFTKEKLRVCFVDCLPLRLRGKHINFLSLSWSVPLGRPAGIHKSNQQTNSFNQIKNLMKVGWVWFAHFTGIIKKKS